jgi:predicted Zn-dependent protease
MAQIAFDADNPGQAASILSAALSANPDQLDVRLRLADLRLSQNSPLSAQLLLGPVKDSTDQRVQKLLAQVRTKIAKDRAF